MGQTHVTSSANHIVVLGGGAWGTALAAGLTTAGRNVALWAREAEVVDALGAGQGNPLFLPGIPLPPLRATTDLACTRGADVVLCVVPAQFSRAVFEAIAAHLRPGTTLVLCSKGIEHPGLHLMSDVARDVLPDAQIAVLSGPSFAQDVARGLPTAVTLATPDEALGKALMTVLGRPTFRPYWSPDIIGAEVGGAIKNVLAIACGIVEGLGLGRSAHAALIARGFSEMTRLGVAMGGAAETLAGLCGLGDLVLTCSSSQSRNMSFGKALGEGRAASDILAARAAVTEGVATAPAIASLAERYDLDLPISRTVTDILSGAVSVRAAVDALLARPFGKE